MQNTREKRAENFLVFIWNHYDSCADYLDGITDTRIFGGNIMEQKDIQAEKQLIQTWKSIMLFVMVYQYCWNWMLDSGWE